MGIILLTIILAGLYSLRYCRGLTLLWQVLALSERFAFETVLIELQCFAFSGF